MLAVPGVGVWVLGAEPLDELRRGAPDLLAHRTRAQPRASHALPGWRCASHVSTTSTCISCPLLSAAHQTAVLVLDVLSAVSASGLLPVSSLVLRTFLESSRDETSRVRVLCRAEWRALIDGFHLEGRQAAGDRTLSIGSVVVCTNCHFCCISHRIRSGHCSARALCSLYVM